ncbi:ferritin-like protein [Shewanella sp. KX20019]|uniref:ferritin-like protein n=1 Tax=Shewanella sp. KX20019 TaxID=2803864 RepID=UPI0019271E49|nr:ferritin-like protein [Shewanella sp. KX20019]QQX79612.1 ferritin-like protein [Shewanella sp. KX20019]
MARAIMGDGVTKITQDNLEEALQQAIEIEIATIPVYLSTYYSINRTPDQKELIKGFTKRLIDKGETKQNAATKALALSAKIMVFANRAGANIMSVVVEEMLHMSLSSNVKQSLFGNPELVGKSPSIWPAYLAGHEPEFPINRAKLSIEQLETFKKIESPVPIDANLRFTSAIPYFTIGDFYQGIEDCIRDHFCCKDNYHPDRPQLVPNRGYYAQNNIDTIYYDKQHKPVYENAADAGGLIHVVDQASALKALKTVVDQGEGKNVTDPFDDDSCHELSHYYKFALLQEELKDIKRQFQKEFGCEFDVENHFIHDFADNAETQDYPVTIQAVSTLTNAMYAYLFIMSQACYHAEEHTQFEIFMFGIHKSMLWILSSLCGEMTGLKYLGSDGQQYTATATFEEYQFSSASSPKSQIIELFNQAVGVNDGIAYLGQRIHDLPNVSIEGFLERSNTPLMA